MHFSIFLTFDIFFACLSRIILYAITMADYEQDNVEACKKDIVKTKVGIDRLMLYHKSVGRFSSSIMFVSFENHIQWCYVQIHRFLSLCEVERLGTININLILNGE